MGECVKTVSVGGSSHTGCHGKPCWSLPGDCSKTSSLYRLGALKWGTGKTGWHHLLEAGEERETYSRGIGILWLDEDMA